MGKLQKTQWCSHMKQVVHTCKEEKAPLPPHAGGRVAERVGFPSRFRCLSREKRGVQAHSTGRVPVNRFCERVLQEKGHCEGQQQPSERALHISHAAWIATAFISGTRILAAAQQ